MKKRYLTLLIAACFTLVRGGEMKVNENSKRSDTKPSSDFSESIGEGWRNPKAPDGSTYISNNQVNAQQSIRGGLIPMPPIPEFTNSLPKWYTANRVQFHWENAAENVAREGGIQGWIDWLQNVQRIIADSGVRVTVGVGRSAAEGAWWPTAIGMSHPSFGTNDILRNAIIGGYRKFGITPIIYYRHDMDWVMQEQHPEWLARKQDGSLESVARGRNTFTKERYRMCQNSPFREFTRQRLIEITERGAGGLYFDQLHMPSGGCFCDYCKARFKQLCGRPMPENPQPGTVEYLNVARFEGYTLAETFASWRESVQRVNPETVLLVSTHPYSTFNVEVFIGLHHSEELAHVGSANKTEFQKGFGGHQHHQAAPVRKLKAAHPEYWLPPRDLTERISWMVSRDILDGAPPEVWVHKPDPTELDEVMHTAAAVVAHGGVAGMSSSALQQYTNTYRKVFAMSDALAPFMEEARPYAWALIHISNELKETLYLEGGRDSDNLYRHVFDHLYAPVLGAAQALGNAHFPYATVSDMLLKRNKFAPETRVLIVPSYEKLSVELKAKIDEVGAAGKITVIKLNGDWQLDAAQKKLAAALIAQAGEPPVKVNGPENLVSSYMINKETGNLLVCLVRDWNWFWFWDKRPGQIRSEERAKQPAIENINIIAPGKQKTLYPAGEAAGAPLDICRFIEIVQDGK